MEVQIASRPVEELPPADRRLGIEGFELPIDLAVADAEDLRRAIGRASAAYGRTGPTGGNPTKRLRLRISRGDGNVTGEAIEHLLSRPLRAAEQTSDMVELAQRVGRARTRRRVEGQGLDEQPQGNPLPRRVAGTTQRYERNPDIVAWVLEVADGHCEQCAEPAPFLGRDGQPFLEVHHVRPLADGGPDSIDNAVACCPNCHRRLHHSPDREELRHELVRGIDRINDCPLVA